MVLVAAVVLTSASFLLVPHAIRAMGAPPSPTDQPPASENRLVAFDALRILLTSAHEIVSFHTDEQTGVTEVVVWHQDVDLDGEIDPSELVVLTHSRFLGHITAASQGWQPSKGDRGFDRLTAPIERNALTMSAFPSKWRGRPDIEIAPVAVGIDGFGLEDLSRKLGAGTYRVVLRWSPNVSDVIEDGPSWFHIGPKHD